jgi:DinB superfamily
MNASEAIRTALSSTQQLLSWYVGDLSDADLLVRPVPGANHIAWQIGHVIAGDVELVKPQLPATAYPELPAGFVEQHGKDTAAQDPPHGFLNKAQYLDLFNRVREATKAAVAKLSDTDLDRSTTGNMAKFAPTLGALFLLVSNHTLMHVGQFTAVRRKLGKPILF